MIPKRKNNGNLNGFDRQPKKRNERKVKEKKVHPKWSKLKPIELDRMEYLTKIVTNP